MNMYIDVKLTFYNREIVMIAVQNDGCELEYASDELKNDREIVMIAVQKNGCALEYASDELKNDREIVMTAIQNEVYVSALSYASDELKSDPELQQMIKRRLLV